MPVENFLNFNGNLFPDTENIFGPANRSFRYGDGVFETLRYANGKVQFLNDHYARLVEGMKALRLLPPAEFSVAYFKEKIEELIVRNGITRGARIRLTVFRKDGGYYTPVTNEVSWLIECYPIDESMYNLNAKGLTVDIYPDYKKPIHKLSSIKSNSSQLYVLAAVYKKENNLDDCIILNTNFSIAEGISSNIFAVKNGVLYTPPIADGCVNGIMRSKIIDVARKNRISVYEVSLAMNVLLNSDELFLTNVVSGISWISTYKTKEFGNTLAQQLVESLNENLD